MGLANVAEAAGYDAVYKGKLHITNFNGRNKSLTKTESDAAAAASYGWNRSDLDYASCNNTHTEHWLSLKQTDDFN